MTNVFHACWRADMKESLTLTASLQSHLFKVIPVILLPRQFKTTLNFIVCQVRFNDYFLLFSIKVQECFRPFSKEV